MTEKDDILKALPTIGKEWGLRPTEEDLDQYADLVTTLMGEFECALNVEGELPPTGSSEERSSYQPEPSENKYNAWRVKSNIQEQTVGKLAGKRVAIKDSINVAGLPMMNGSALLFDYVSDYDATLVKRILKEGGIIAGKAVCEDFCFSGGSITAATGHVLNPLDTTRVAGGSSSGSGALVAAGDVDMAIGGDQGGSIRIPSSWCGIVGLKPTHGLVPYTGAMSMNPNLDHLGPMTKTIADCALLLEVIAGNDGFDKRQPADLKVPLYSKNLSSDVSKLKVALLEEGFTKCEPEVVETVRAAVDLLRPHLAAVDEVSIPIVKDYAAFWMTQLVSGVYEVNFKNKSTYPLFGGPQDMKLQHHVAKYLKERANDLAPTVKLCIYAGAYMEKKHGTKLFSHCINCTKKLRKEVDAMLENYDVIIMPTLPSVAPKSPATDCSVKDVIESTFSMLANTALFNTTQHPALTVNAGMVRGLPVGMMMATKHWHEQTILNLGYAWEQIRDKQ